MTSAPAEASPPTGNWLVGDWRRFDPRPGIALVLVALAFLPVLRHEGALAVLVALGMAKGVVLGLSVRPEDRTTTLLAFALYGGLVTALGELLGARETPAVIALMLIALVSGLFVAAGPGVAKIGTTSALWFVIVAITARTDRQPLRLTVAFVVGCLVLAALFGLLARRGVGATNLPHGLDSLPAVWRRFREQVRHDPTVLAFAVVLSVASGLAMILADRWFPHHPKWLPLTVLLLLRPSEQGTLLRSLERMTGTILGGALAFVLVLADPGIGKRTLELLTLASGFLFVSTVRVGFTVSTFFMTVMVIASVAVAGETLGKSARIQVEEVLLGVVIAVAATALLWLIDRRAAAVPPTTQPTD